MATLDLLKHALRQKADAIASLKRPLSDQQYSDGFDILAQDTGGMSMVYQQFIIPQLSQVAAPLFNSRVQMSVLEIGPGPKSVLGHLPVHMRRKIKKYTAFEPCGLFASRLKTWIHSNSGIELEHPPEIRAVPFPLEDNIVGECSRSRDKDQYDLILFCHSMYGMKPKSRFIERALEMLVKRRQGGMVVVFHRDGSLHLNGLVCHRTASFPDGSVRVADNDATLDSFASFIAGFVMPSTKVGRAIRTQWREVCRQAGHREDGHLWFSSPQVMAAFTTQATTLPELTAQVPWQEKMAVKNWEARLHQAAAVVRPTEIHHVQQCVQWALRQKVGLTVVGGGHSGHCLWPNVVSVDMDAFTGIDILPTADVHSGGGTLLVAEAGCRTGDIIRKAVAAGVTVPLGARPSVGVGLWLQGGLGHLSRLHGLACDAIVGAVVVSVQTGQVLCIGNVPSQHQPADAVRPEDEADLLWALKGAGTNMGIVVRVVFKTHPAPTFRTRHWVLSLGDGVEARVEARVALAHLDQDVAAKLARNCSADAYLFHDHGQLRLGVTVTEAFMDSPSCSLPAGARLGPEASSQIVDGVGLFDTEMYLSAMHGGHGGGQTSSFKRCVFLACIGDADMADRLVAAVQTRPSARCYLHLLQGGGAVGDVGADATAFGCRDWDFACVITAVWARDGDDSAAAACSARSAVRWVYSVAAELLACRGSRGAYGADLGPDPRDAALAAQAFGPNRVRLARLKHRYDPHHVLPYACPLSASAALSPQKVVLLVTGECGAGKDYCAAVWASFLAAHFHHVRVASISDATKREYAAAAGADLDRLLNDRVYKEQHRPALTAFYQNQVQTRPQLPEEHFLDTVYGSDAVDVLLITGMRDEAPIATLSHLMPDTRLLELHIQASPQTRQIRRGGQNSINNNNNDDDDANKINANPTALDYRPTLVFVNDTTGTEAAERFAQQYLLPFFHDDLWRLASMVRPVLNYPRPGIEFQHVLGISQQPAGLDLCSSLLKTHLNRDWATVDAVACCETGGLVYASPLALRVGVPLVLIRDAGKLPPPTLSAPKLPSHISSLATSQGKEKRIEMERDVVPRGGSVVVVDDVLATGVTLCAVLQLLRQAGIRPEDMNVIVVVEFPVHRGRELLRQRGFGGVTIQSLLVFGGV